jgi:hypothetical protein
MFTITIVNREKIKIEGEFDYDELDWLSGTMYRLKSFIEREEPEPVKLHEKHDEAAARHSFPTGLDGGPIF